MKVDNVIYSGQSLVNCLNDKMIHARYRIWVASPYIGSFKEVQQIIGGKWMRSCIDFRLLTDINAGFIREDTFEAFKDSPKTEIRSLESFHAKIYIIDDWCLITSANLTGTAFCRRYEIGTVLSNIFEVEQLFDEWWQMGSIVSTISTKTPKVLLDYQDGKRFNLKCKLPQYKTKSSDYFLQKCDKFISFALLYEKVTGRNQKMVKDGFTLYQEIDYFFNFLYHESSRPSNAYKLKKARLLDNKEREKEILRYFHQLPYKSHSEDWRLERTVYIQKVLDAKHIATLTMPEVKGVLSRLHCLCSYPINRTKIPNNNSISDIRNAWLKLLTSEYIDGFLINKTKDSIKFFGESSICELLAWYYPKKYPMMNMNSESGMRFLGIEL
jgi:Phosphatidylserine/phosphatidylglycerophosphate/cardiolipin synthases and related enzymes